MAEWLVEGLLRRLTAPLPHTLPPSHPPPHALPDALVAGAGELEGGGADAVVQALLEGAVFYVVPK